MIASLPEQISEAALLRLQSRLAERAAEHDRDGSFPFENFQLLREHGLLGLTVPRKFGGAEAELGTAARVVREVAYAEPATALILTMQYCFLRGINGNSRWTPRISGLVQ